MCISRMHQIEKGASSIPLPELLIKQGWDSGTKTMANHWKTNLTSRQDTEVILGQAVLQVPDRLKLVGPFFGEGHLQQLPVQAPNADVNFLPLRGHSWVNLLWSCHWNQRNGACGFWDVKRLPVGCDVMPSQTPHASEFTDIGCGKLLPKKITASPASKGSHVSVEFAWQCCRLAPSNAEPGAVTCCGTCGFLQFSVEMLKFGVNMWSAMPSQQWHGLVHNMWKPSFLRGCQALHRREKRESSATPVMSFRLFRTINGNSVPLSG